MTSEIVYENSAHRDYDHSQDVYYLVRIPGEYPREEWKIITPSWSKDGMKYTRYPIGRGPTREQAELFLREYSINHPETPVRVERWTLTPRIASPRIATFTPRTAKQAEE